MACPKYAQNSKISKSAASAFRDTQRPISHARMIQARPLGTWLRCRDQPCPLVLPSGYPRAILRSSLGVRLVGLCSLFVRTWRAWHVVEPPNVARLVIGSVIGLIRIWFPVCYPFRYAFGYRFAIRFDTRFDAHGARAGARFADGRSRGSLVVRSWFECRMPLASPLLRADSHAFRADGSRGFTRTVFDRFTVPSGASRNRL